VATGQDKPPEIVPLRRATVRDVLTTVLAVVAAYLIISQLADIGFGTIANQLRKADIAWAVVALILAQLTFVTQAVSLRGAVLTPLPLMPCAVLESAIKFINLTVPGSAGRIAINVRFLQRMGASMGEAVASGAVTEVSQTINQIAIALLTLPFVRINIDTSRFKLGAAPGHLLIGIVVALIVAVAVLIASPNLRAKVVPELRGALTSLRAVARTRRKRLELFGGNIGTELLFALTLGAVCRAYGVDLSLAELLLVNTAASAFAGLIPTPGGIGAAEASLTALLVALDIDKSTALAIALTHRLCTFYLPPIWGSLSLKWLQDKGYV
jgi:uncharacterized membrane protein YbhN (UPF0104 family)